MNRFDFKPQFAKVSGRVGDMARDFAAPLQAAHLSPLSGMILAFLGATAIGSAAFAAYALLGPASVDDSAAVPDWTPPTLAVVDLDPPKPPSADVETLSRPIFTKGRRPSQKAAKTAISDAGPLTTAPTGLAVAAIVKNRKASQAFVVSLETPEGAWKKIGDTIDAWTISAIEVAEITLKNGGQTTKVKLYPDPQAQPAPDAFPPQQPPPIPVPPPVVLKPD
ncbi:hypothetical protein [Methylocystis parvus]|uniref:General secretion pathway protein GspN n=1 Tax=Methylocystis parvus TaxID=134 RepID=A0A6B8LUR4_9HYPH|nr:hypothetical protein [Methylocystis parvus]QGM96087.1 hypothetical protein F7D14_00305 [Methylocystis parvus]WBK00089.1 hypothetical protein MMG94_19310 [Methylocystis parvus OBBP]